MQLTLNLNLHDRLAVLETALRQTHRGKGLGFVCGNTVIDIRIMSQALLGVISVMSTVIDLPLVMLLRADNRTQCSLSDTQVSSFTNKMYMPADV